MPSKTIVCYFIGLSSLQCTIWISRPRLLFMD